MQNVSGALKICRELGLTEERFYNAMLNFKGPSKRLQLLSKNESVSVFLDFAHSPSNISATLKAVRQQYPDRQLVACMELYSASNLNENFLDQYNGTMDLADVKYVYYNKSLLKKNKMKIIDEDQISAAFGNSHIKIFTDHNELLKELYSINWQNKNLIFMSSGDFSGINFDEVANKIALKN